ncbi:hypothetical protein PZB74_03605 [Porifericola rhodea]|uniref:DUF6249 domain-containing protein n=1 Tax=Porifericola rhodea TaxID=930972 RepID=UPI002664F6DC|nr:DUF6249 domain-containing protein [Porifericola rhodea]WKN32432.1 hypothetical protein PZB74_03605 [Porifericola rhodea]
MHFIEAPLIVGIIFFGIVNIIKAFSNHFLRRKMIDNNQLDDNTLKALKLEHNPYEGLKWGMITLFGGIGLILIEYIPTDYNSPLPFGLEAVMISLGFLSYYFVRNRQSSTKI